ncbi:hypothetical protein C0993_012795 [Termitomyces sp. T159_Od127]|nr:hypothetical protein C0993_012795 [Termitomyces sp. T159_Od127]
MEEDNDVLDWGAEDEEHKNQDAGKNGVNDARSAAGDNDDAEDAVSLGDEEESQDFYLYQQEEQKQTTVEGGNSEVNVAPRSVGADEEPQTVTLSGLQPEDSSISQVSSPKTGTPRRNSSTGRRSPQPTLAPRITHALPPKPVVTNVPFLPPSHPSIVEATAMSAATRTSGRSESQHSKVYGTSTSTVSTTGNGKGLTSGSELPPLPRGWEAREARSGSGGTYYYNMRTHESTWTRPVSNSSSSSPSRHLRGDSARRRGSDSFLGAKSSSPRRSDNTNSQSQELSRHSRRAQPLDHDHVTDLQIIAPTNASTMSYNDRHYRPGAGTDDTNASGNTNDRPHRIREDVDPRFNLRTDQAFTPSPEASPRARERPRSLSPLPMSSQVTSRGRDSRLTRFPRTARGGWNGNTDADSPIYRDRDPLPGSYPPRDNWDQSNACQESRRHLRHYHETPYDASFNDNRPPMLPRNGNARGRRDRDQPMREESQIMPDSRTRSPPRGNRETHIRHDEPQDAQHWPMPQLRGHEGHQTTTNSIASPQLSTNPPLPRKRDRPSRFGQQHPPSILQHGLPSARLPVELQTHPHRPVEEDDPFVPDDIRSPPPHELQQRREGSDEKSSLLQASVQAAENGPSASVYHQVRHSKRTDERDDMENASSSEQRRARPPLPPQADEFQEVSNRPRERLGRPPQDTSALSRVNDQDGQPAMGLRDLHGPTHANSPFGSRPRPYGQGRTYENNYDLEGPMQSVFRRQRNVDMTRFTSDGQESFRKDVEYNIQKRRFPKVTQEEEVEEMMVREENMAHEGKYTGIEMAPPEDIRRPETEDKSTGPGYPSGQTFAPRGPRAMHSSVNQDEAPSPILGGFGPGPRGGNQERSPPPHMGNRGRENGGWREERGGHVFERGGRRDRGRFNDYPRPPLSSASGPNSVPIGNHRKQPIGNGGPSGLPARMPSDLSVPEMAETNQRQARGGMRGGAGASSHPHRGLYDRGYGINHADRFRAGNYEHDGSLTRRRDSSRPPFERQPLNVDAGVSQGDHFSTSPRDALYEPALPDLARLARTWTPRGEAPPEVFMGNSGRATSPSITKSLPHLSPLVDMGRSHNRDRPGSSRGRLPPPDGRPHQADRFSRQPNESRRAGLEGRLSDRFDDSALSHQSRGFPPNAEQSNYPVNGGVLDMHAPDTLTRAERRKSLPEFRDVPYAKRFSEKDTKLHERHQQGSFHYPPESYIPRESDMSHRNIDGDVVMDAPLHSNTDRDEHMGRKRRLDNRPEMARRPGSLLERLEMGNDGNIAQEETTFSRSLSDRVQVPLKRDRDEMVNDGFGADDALGFDDRKHASKKLRRKGKIMKMV